MDGKHIRRMGPGIAIALAAIALAGCPRTPQQPPPGGTPATLTQTAKYGFVFTIDPKGCPSALTSFGPPGSTCNGQGAAACRKIRHGDDVSFTSDTGGDFVVTFTNGSAFSDDLKKNPSSGGFLQKTTRRSNVSPPPEEPFPFVVQAPHGTGCPNDDPQIILN